MTYYEKYLLLKSEAELKLAMKEDIKVALFLDLDRIKAIEDAGNKVANEKGWMESKE